MLSSTSGGENTGQGNNGPARTADPVIVDVSSVSPPTATSQTVVAYQGARTRANRLLIKYGHILPLAAVLACLLVASIITIERQVSYSRTKKKKNDASSDSTTTTTTTTAAPTTTTTDAPADNSASQHSGSASSASKHGDSD